MKQYSDALARSNFVLFVFETLLPLILETGGHDNLTVLLNSVLQFTLNLDLLQFIL